MPSISLAVDALGRPLAVLIIATLLATAVLLVVLPALLGLDPAALDDVGSWRWLPDA